MKRLLVSVGLLGALALVGRYGAVTPQGRMFVEARANGLKLGRIGRLHIEGVGGDIWSDFTVRRLTIADALTFALNQIKPDEILDLATLTGASTVALGPHIAGVMSNNPEMTGRLLGAD